MLIIKSKAHFIDLPHLALLIMIKLYLIGLLHKATFLTKGSFSSYLRAILHIAWSGLGRYWWIGHGRMRPECEE
jgi:hypothetical protein